MRENWTKGDVVHLGVRTKDLEFWGKQITNPQPTFMSENIINTAMALFTSHYDFNKPMRSLSVKVSDIRSASCPVQTDMFLTEPERSHKERLEFVTDK